jgi:hypothetical protein
VVENNIGCGAGIGIIGGAPLIENNTIRENTGSCDGAGIGLSGADSATISHNLITANLSSSGNGGGIAVGTFQLY